MRVKVLRRREQNFIKSNAENGHKKRSWGKYIYLLTLLVILTFIVRWGIENIFYVKGIGFLEAKTAIVAARATGRIMKINCTINDTVVAGTPLVWLDNPDSASTISTRPVRAEFYTNERRIIEARRQIALLNQRLYRNKLLLKGLLQELARAETLFRHNAIRRSEHVKLRQEVEAAEFKLTELQIELRAALRTLESYEKQGDVLFDSSGFLTNGNGYESALRASQNGIISAVYKKTGAVVKAGEPVIKIIDPSQNYVKAYFEGSFESQLEAGEPATVKFENGDSEEGIIRKIYPITSAQPPEIKHRFGKVRRFIIAEIAPVPDQNWHHVHETQVVIYTRRRWF